MAKKKKHKPQHAAPKHAAPKKANATEPKTKPEKPNKPKIKASKGTIGVIVALCLLILITYIDGALNLKKQAKELKSEIKASATQFKDNNYTEAEKTWEQAEETADKMSKTLSKPKWKLVSYLPIVGKDLKSANTVLAIFDGLSEEIVYPGFKLLKEYPIDQLKIDDGFNAKLCSAYINLVNDAMPSLEKYAKELKDVKFRFIKLGGEEYTDKIDKVLELFNENKALIPLLKDIFGDGDDRFYVLAAQNMAEIRASGGFPGSIGSMEIKDGVLKIGSFEPINSVIAFINPYSVGATMEERELFSWWVDYPRDMCYIPDFERVGENWAVSYEEKTGPHVDGVISLTPVIIGEMLKATGQEIELSDGTIINSENATKVIQHDLYFDYFYEGSSSAEANDKTDQLFAEIAGKTMEVAVGDLKFENLAAFLEIFNKGVKDRTILMWFEDRKTEDLAKELKAAGNLGAGAFFSCSVPSKLGWFFDMKADIKQVANDKYKVTLTLSNSITQTEINKGSVYVIGDTYGTICGFLHLTAPKGGEISDLKADDGTRFKEGNYHGYDLYYTHNIRLRKDDKVTITYTITSKEPFDFIMTPTLEDYK